MWPRQGEVDQAKLRGSTAFRQIFWQNVAFKRSVASPLKKLNWIGYSTIPGKFAVVAMPILDNAMGDRATKWPTVATSNVGWIAVIKGLLLDSFGNSLVADILPREGNPKEMTAALTRNLSESNLGSINIC
jgi:hypothetical protein